MAPEKWDLILAAWQATLSRVSLVDVVCDNGGVPSEVGEPQLHTLDGLASTVGQPLHLAVATRAFDLLVYEKGTTTALVEYLWIGSHQQMMNTLNYC